MESILIKIAAAVAGLAILVMSYGWGKGLRGAIHFDCDCHRRRNSYYGVAKFRSLEDY